MPPDDLPIPSPADDTSGVKGPLPRKQHEGRSLEPESESRGGQAGKNDQSLEQLRRDEAGQS